MSKKLSVPLKMIDAAYYAKKPRSHRRTNDGLCEILHAAIRMGIRFGPKDVVKLTAYKSEHWMDPEREYAVACKFGNLSACQAYEAALERKPYIHNGKRLAVGSEFCWYGANVTVTSFEADEYLLACEYDYADRGRPKITRRHTITHADIVEARACERRLPKLEKRGVAIGKKARDVINNSINAKWTEPKKRRGDTWRREELDWLEEQIAKAGA